MSTRAQRRRQEKFQSTSPKKPSGGVIAVVIAAAAMIAIIVYAVIQRNQVSGAAVSPQAATSFPPPVKVGAPAPAFSVNARGGVISSRTFAGKPYLLEIFATWCPHCQNMTRVLRDIRKKFPPSRFGMVSVTGSTDGAGSTIDNRVPEDQADVDTFDAAYDVTWPSAFDKDLTVAKTWGFLGFPGIFIVDKRGVVVFAHSGEVDEKALIGAIKKAGA